VKVEKDSHGIMNEDKTYKYGKAYKEIGPRYSQGRCFYPIVPNGVFYAWNQKEKECHIRQ
jgi:hypothetical protein